MNVLFEEWDPKEREDEGHTQQNIAPLQISKYSYWKVELFIINDICSTHVVWNYCVFGHSKTCCHVYSENLEIKNKCKPKVQIHEFLGTSQVQLMFHSIHDGSGIGSIFL